MLIDILRPEMWEDLNDSLKSHMKLPEKGHIRAYRGLAQAVFEIAHGTTHFMAHKKSVAAIQGQTPIFDGLLPYYYKEAYKVQTQNHEQLQDLKSWVEGLNKDTAFVVMAEDHPVTGELYSFVDALDALLNEKRIVSIRVSHARHFFEDIPLGLYSVRICSFGAEQSVALCGERFRSPPLMVQGMSWSLESFLAGMELARQGRAQNPVLVAEFENEIQSVAQTWFQPQSPRLHDRAVCVLPDISAESLTSLLSQKLALPPRRVSALLTTTNLCKWQALQMFRSWWSPQPTPEQLRGMIVVSVELLQNKNFVTEFVSSYKEIKQQQSWDL